MKRRRRVAMVGGTAVLVLVLASCGMGRTGEATDVGHASATLTGEADRTDPGAITYWFEYGETTAYGLTTPVQGATVSSWIPVAAEVDGLEPTTTYHYRLCVDDDQGEGSCGEDRTFTTTAADTVTGNVYYQQPGNPSQAFGIVLDVSSDADGAHPAGTIGVYLLDPTGFRYGDVSCLRVEGDRASVGFDSHSPWFGDLVIYVRSGLPSRFDLVPVADAPSSCPDPATGAYGFEATSGSFTVVDAP